MVHALDGKLGIDVSTADTTREFELGDEVACSDGNTYRYVEASAAIDAYAACALDESGQVAELTTTLSGAKPTQVVVPQIALASGEFGWAVVRGEAFSVLGAASCAADVKLYTTATAGVVDDASTGTDLIQGLRLNAAVGSTAAAASATAVNGMQTNAQD